MDKSEAYQFVSFVWEKNGHYSYVQINAIMHRSVQFAIDAMFDFSIDDIEKIFSDFRGGYWFGYTEQRNGGHGAFLYRDAAKKNNVSACQSFEKFMGIKPFILNGMRTYMAMTFKNIETRRFYRVTGFDIEKKLIRMVSFDNHNEEGLKKLHVFTNSEWNEFRKNIVE